MSTHQHKCPCCGKTFWDFTSMTKAHTFDKAWNGFVCNDCANWLKLAASKNANLEVIAGVCYDIQPPQKNIGAGDMLGGDGYMHYILKKNGEIKKSNDIWKYGEVPQCLRDRLPDTGWWISGKLFHRLRRGRFECQNIGCYDRYHCLLYNIKQEYESGPYNAIPRDWLVGDEKCPSFCNILDIEHYDSFETIDQ